MARMLDQLLDYVRVRMPASLDRTWASPCGKTMMSPLSRRNRQEFVGEVGYIVRDARPWEQLGTDTFVVRNGAIRRVVTWLSRITIGDLEPMPIA
jgi:hypothetical protein